MQGWLWVKPLLSPEAMQAFAKQVNEYTKSHPTIRLRTEERSWSLQLQLLSEDPKSSGTQLEYAVALHDAVTLYAHAATKVLSQGGDLRNGTMVAETVRSTTIDGVGDRAVILDENGDRIVSYEVMNYVQGESGETDSVSVGVYSSSSKKYTVERAVVWPGSDPTVVPVDYHHEVCDFAGLICLQVPSCTYRVCILSGLWAPHGGRNGDRTWWDIL